MESLRSGNRPTVFSTEMVHRCGSVVELRGMRFWLKSASRRMGNLLRELGDKNPDLRAEKKESVLPRSFQRYKLF